MKHDKLQKIENYLFNKKVLLITSNGIDRSTWRRVIQSYGVRPTDILTANTLHEASEYLKKQTINIVISSQYLKDRHTFKLLEHHMEEFQNRSNFVYILIGQNNEYPLCAYDSEYEIDDIIIKPYTIDIFKNTIELSLLKKACLSKEKILYYEILDYIDHQDFKRAKDKLSDFFELKMYEPEPYYLLGLYHHEQGEYKKASEAYEAALKYDPFHYMALCKSFDLHRENQQYDIAFEHIRKIFTHYTVTYKRIPSILDVGLKTKQFQCVLDFCYLCIEINTVPKELIGDVSKAMAICAQNLIEDRASAFIAKKAINKTIDITRPEAPARLVIIQTMIDQKDYPFARSIIDQVPTVDMSPELHTLDLLLTSLTKEGDTVYQEAKEKIRRNIHTEKIYEILIQSCADVGRSKNYIEEIKEEALERFPNMKFNEFKIAN